MTVATLSWADANQRYLSLSLNQVKRSLERCVSDGTDAKEEQADDVEDHRLLKDIVSSMSYPPSLEALCSIFKLSPFERRVLLLCAGVELDSKFARLCAVAQGEARKMYPTFSLALATQPGAHWSALTKAAPLRRWGLIEVGNGEGLTASPLTIDERILHHLVGVSHLDHRLDGLLTQVALPNGLPPSHARIAREIADMFTQFQDHEQAPLIQLLGEDTDGKIATASAAFEILETRLYRIRGSDIPMAVAEREMLLNIWQREAALNAALLIDYDGDEGPDVARSVLPFVERIRGLTILAARDSLPLSLRHAIYLDVKKPTHDEQRTEWRENLNSPETDHEIDRIVSQFDLGFREIQAISREVLGRSRPSASEQGSTVWEACRAHSRPRLTRLAQRIEPKATWADLVLPESQIETLRNISKHSRYRSKVYYDWGFASKSSRGLGIGALFAGPSGTGKTLAAEVLARDLRLDLYRVDLSQVVSKYIGETEKNLGRVFDAAESGGAVLLFDEADALFGRRSTVKDSHDRYANIEISYLLQRMEAYSGLAILTTNMKDAIDPAFLRRIRFIVEFPFPELQQRTEIWKHVFPADTPTEGLNIPRLARLNIAGGNIRNIAINAAFVAANDGEKVRMKHIQSAIRNEYAKLGKPMTDPEVMGLDLQK